MEQKLIPTRTLILALLLALAFGFFARPAWAQQFVLLNYPGATSTTPRYINNLGVVVGDYSLSDGILHAFVFSQGTFTNIDVPSAVSSDALGINDNGTIVGYYADSTTGALHGFLLTAGAYSTIDFPGAANTVTAAINNAGQIVGGYTSGPTISTPFQGYELVFGTFSTINYPGAVATAIYAINNTGTIAGTFYDAVGGGAHGFEYSPSASSFTNVVTYPGALQTFVTGINDNGLLVGVIFEGTPDLKFQGFTFLNGEFSFIGAPPSPDTNVYNLATNNSAQVMGGSNTVVNGQRVLGNGFSLQTGAHIVTTLQSLTLNVLGNQYVATLTISNTGSLPADGVIVTGSKLNAAATSSALPITLTTIGDNNPATVTLTYPLSAGSPGHPGVLTISESYSGGSSGGGMRVVLP